MHWLSNPKVRLALIVNGLYFISLLTPTTPQAPSRLFARTFEHSAPREIEWKSKLVFPRLPAPSGPSRAATWVNKSHDQLDVYLANDLTLVQRPGYRLQLSPNFTTKASSPEAPPTVLMRFVSYSDGPANLRASRVSITADGVALWDEGAGPGHSGPQPPTTVKDDGTDGEVVESRGISLPYGIFFQIINSRQVVLKVGSDTFQLTAAQIEALRDMHRCLPQSPDSPPPPAAVPAVTSEKKQSASRARSEGRVSKN
jgi:hypothetical protein